MVLRRVQVTDAVADVRRAVRHVRVNADHMALIPIVSVRGAAVPVVICR